MISINKIYSIEVAGDYNKNTEKLSGEKKEDDSFKFFEGHQDGSETELESDYNEKLTQTSAKILNQCDTDGDGKVSNDEFAQKFYDTYADDIMAYYAKTGEANNLSPEQVKNGIKSAVDMMSKIIGSIDAFENGDVNSISVEELSTLIDYLDEYGWHEDADGNYVKDNNGLGEVSKEALIAFYDYCSDGGQRNLEYGRKFRTGQEISQEDIEAIKLFISQPPLMALIQQADEKGIDLK